MLFHDRIHARALLGLGLALVVGSLACGGGDSSGPPKSGLKTVLVANNEFQPATVTIAAGDTILWSWVAGSNLHNILSTGSPSFASLGDSSTTFNAPKSYQVIFNATGTYRYYCSTHGGPAGNGMAGQVVVNP